MKWPLHRAPSIAVLLTGLFLMTVALAKAQAETYAIRYHLSRAGKTSLAVYDAKGIMVRELLHGLAQNVGDHVVTWDGLDRDGKAVPAGSYNWKLLQSSGLHSQYVMSVGSNYPIGTNNSSSGGPGTHVASYTVAVDSTGIYIAALQTENIETCMLKLSLDGKRRLWSQSLPTGPNGQGVAWDGARSIAVDKGEVYLLGRGGPQRVYVSDAATGAALRIVEVGQNAKPLYEEDKGAIDMTIRNGVLAVSYQSQNEVRWYDPKTGTLLDTAAVPAPSGIAVGASGAVYVSSGDKVVRLTQADHSLSTLAGGLSDPGRLDVDPVSGDILVYENGSQQIVRLSPEGKVLRTYGAAGGRALGLYTPQARQNFSGLSDLCADGAGGFFIAEPYAPPRRVAHFNGEGVSVREWYGGQRWAPHASPEPDNPNVVWMTTGADKSGATRYLMRLVVDYKTKTWRVHSTYRYVSPDSPVHSDSFNEGGFFHIYEHGGAKYVVLDNLQILKVDEKNWKLVPATVFLGVAQWNDRNGDGQIQEDEKTPFKPSIGKAVFPLITFVDANFDYYFIDVARRPYTVRKYSASQWTAVGAPVYGDVPDGKEVAVVPPRFRDDVAEDWRFCGYLHHDAKSDSLYAAFNPWTVNWGQSVDSYMQHWDAAGAATWGAGEQGPGNGQVRAGFRSIAGVTHGCVVATDFDGGWHEGESANTYVWDKDGLFVGGIMDEIDLTAAPNFMYRLGGEFCHSTLYTFPNGDVYFYGNWENEVRIYKVTGWDDRKYQTGSLTIAAPSTPDTGQGLTAEYFDNKDFTDPRTTRVDAKVDFDWGNQVPTGTQLTSPDNYSVRWRGAVRPTYGPRYTGSWSVTRNAEYFGGATRSARVGGSAMEFKFKGRSIAVVGVTGPGSGQAMVSVDGGAEERIDCYSAAVVNDATLFSKNDLTPGDHVLTVRVLGWPNRSKASNGDQVTLDKFVVDGQDYDDAGLEYTFFIYAKDGTQFWLNGELMCTDWFIKAAASEKTATLKLLRQANPIQLSYFKEIGNGRVSLSWSSPWEAKAPIPTSQLFSNVFTAPLAEEIDGAIFSHIDATTRGDWKGKCGTDGYYVIGSAAQYPSYVKVKITGREEAFPWPGSATELRALQRPGVTTDRSNACLSSNPIVIDLDFTDGQWHRFGFYALDGLSTKNYGIAAIVQDAESGQVFDSRRLNTYYDGKYIFWNLKGHVQVKIYCIAGPTTIALISGLFFDPPAGKVPVAENWLKVSGKGQVIPDGTSTPDLESGTDYGSVALGATQAHTFILANTGTGVLNLIGTPRVLLTGSPNNGFSLVTPPPASLPPGGQTSFTVRFKPTAIGQRRVRVSIVNDSDDSPYDFVIQGAGRKP
jgi:hypothetical protein